MSAYQILVLKALRLIIRLIYEGLTGHSRAYFKDEYEAAIKELKQ